MASARMVAERAAVVAAAIRAVLRAEELIAQDLRRAVGWSTAQFPGYGLDELTQAAARQPPCVDIRPLVPTVLERWPSLQSLGLVPAGAPVPDHALDLTLLSAELTATYTPTREGQTA